MGMEIFGTKTRIMVEGTAVDNTVVVYTVPASKKFYLEETLLYITDGTTGTGIAISRTVGDVRKRLLAGVKNLSSIGGANSVQSLFPSFITLTAGEDIAVISDTASVNVTCAILGFEVDA